MNPDTIILNDTYDIVPSPDDGGWYIQRFPDHATSQIFESKAKALAALREPGTIWWDA